MKEKKKVILMGAIALQFLSLFFDIWGRTDYHSHREGLFVTGFSIISFEASPPPPIPIPGILSIIWIGINLFILKKNEFKTNAVYILMSFVNFVFTICFFAISLLSFEEVCRDGSPRNHLYAGMYIIISSFVLYTIAYILLSVKTLKS
jgi:membrane-bound ClpP family serine protease